MIAHVDFLFDLWIGKMLKIFIGKTLQIFIGKTLAASEGVGNGMCMGKGKHGRSVLRGASL